MGEAAATGTGQPVAARQAISRLIHPDPARNPPRVAGRLIQAIADLDPPEPSPGRPGHLMARPVTRRVAYFLAALRRPVKAGDWANVPLWRRRFDLYV
jgi:hypothetical protein